MRTSCNAGVALIVLAAAFATVPPRAHPQAPGTAGASPAAEGRRSDLAQFRTAFMARDRSYSAAARSEAEQRLAGLEAGAAEVSSAYFELELARIVALADNGHTMSFAGPRSLRYNRVPVRMAPFGEEFYVLRARGESADLLGARLVAIDGRPLAELRATARSLAGGTDGWRDRSAAYLLESPQLLHALGATRAPGAAEYRFVLPDGRTVTRSLRGDDPPAAAAPNPFQVTIHSVAAVRLLYPARVAGEDSTWQRLLDPSRAPWALQDGAIPFRWRELAEVEALVIEMRQNRGTDEHPLNPFFAAVEAGIRGAAPRHLVLDMRFNGGGDLNTTRDFMRRLPQLVTGRIFVLTSPWTFSAAISSVGYLKQAAPDRVTIVGEMVGDRLEFWAEGRPVQLQHSGAWVLMATERHDYASGCRPYRDCHGSVVRNPIAVASLAPDIAAPWTIEAYRAGRDPGLEAVIAALR